MTGVPGLTLSGSFAVEVNSTGSRRRDVRGRWGHPTITFAADAPLRVSGAGVVLGIAGQVLQADVIITKSTTSLTVDVTNGSLSFGTVDQPLVRAANVHETSS